jgi:hypothetical protein
MYHVNLLKRYIERPQVDETPSLLAVSIAEDIVEPKTLTEYPLQQKESVHDVSICHHRVGMSSNSKGY